jgi:hypothetical protein
LELGFTSKQGKVIRDNIISGNYVPISAYNELSEKFKALKADTDTSRDKLLGVTKEAERARNELKALKNEIKMQTFNRAVEERILNFAREQNVEWNDSGLVRSLVDLATVKEMENGALFGLDDQLTKILSEKSFLARPAQAQGEFGNTQYQSQSEVLGGYDDSVQGIISAKPGTIRMSTQQPQATVQPYADAQRSIQQQQAQMMIQGAAPASQPVAGFTPQQSYQQMQIANQASQVLNPIQGSKAQFMPPGTQVAMEEQARALSIAKMRSNGGLTINPR